MTRRSTSAGKARTPGERRDWLRRSLLLSFGMSGVMLIALSFGAVAASRAVARAQALDDAQRMTTRLGELVVGPLLARMEAGDAVASAELTRTLDIRVAEGSLRELVVWDLAGSVVYARDASLIGTRSGIPAEATDAIRNTVSDTHFATAPELRGAEFIAAPDGYVEAYVPLAVDDRRLALEVYYDYRRVGDAADALLRRILPLVLAPLALLQLVQIPIVARLVRRVGRYEGERVRLLERSASASEAERRRIAGDLHDGPVQELAGVGLLLDAADAMGPDPRSDLVRSARRSVRAAMDSLRRLMVDIYPPDLSGAALPGAIEALTAVIRQDGVRVTTDLECMPGLSDATVILLYQISRETLANVARHSGARHVTVVLRRTSLRGERAAAHLSVLDDGVGTDLTRLDRRADGHLGLRLLADRVAAAGGSFTVESADGVGTRVGAELPLG